MTTYIDVDRAEDVKKIADGIIATGVKTADAYHVACAVLFEGNIEFYGKSGFTYAREFEIRYHDLAEVDDSSFFLCKELKPGYLDGITGVYQTPQAYYVKDEDVDEFDKDFLVKEKLKLSGQIF